jgi:hypothetical protein
MLRLRLLLQQRLSNPLTKLLFVLKRSHWLLFYCPKNVIWGAKDMARVV